MIFESNSPKDTYEIGRNLGSKAKSGEIYCLTGELGSGKTLFSQGFAEGLGIKEPVNSPTFTLIQEYEEGRLPLYHFDVYRIENEDEMFEIGYEDYFYGSGVCLVEWANLIEAIIPENAVWISLERDGQKGFDFRRISIERKMLRHGRGYENTWD